MARLLPYVLLQIDVIHDKYLNTRRRPVTSGGNGDYGHKRLAASFVVALVDCHVHAELVTFLCERSQFIRTKCFSTERDRDGAWKQTTWQLRCRDRLGVRVCSAGYLPMCEWIIIVRSGRQTRWSRTKQANCFIGDCARGRAGRAKQTD